MFLLTSVFHRVTFSVVAILLLYFIFMDTLLYSRVHKYSIKPNDNKPQYEGIIPCSFDPLCVVTVKGLMLDHPNYYLLGPLAAIVNQAFGISDCKWISPNLISGFHVLVAIAAGKCASSDSLSQRRLAVLLFEIRTWLDDLDGHVARKRKHIDGEHSDVGSVGYFVDGICDALGCIALMIGIFCYFQKNPPGRGYEKLNNVIPFVESRDVDPETIYKRRRSRNVIGTVILFVGYLLVSSVGWNRYISLYQDLLETDTSSSSITKDELLFRQAKVMQSSSFWAMSIAWKLVNFHIAVDCMLLAMFLDRLWEYMRTLRWLGYIVVLVVVYFTEFHFLESYAFVHGSASVPTFEFTSTDTMPIWNETNIQR
ncbi:ceramide phosphoethanolamine synthase [Leptopilina boulardi]|uniref:ceramide phosphoethanolamine synthase n=1 Tax=Leptopilina boulardi TaxID=63433 RepID=UPI0021F66FD3|nr:ceramide phosphoethanolamine synthase [Leptopilina boulardi]